MIICFMVLYGYLSNILFICNLEKVSTTLLHLNHWEKYIHIIMLF